MKYWKKPNTSKTHIMYFVFSPGAFWCTPWTSSTKRCPPSWSARLIRLTSGMFVIIRRFSDLMLNFPKSWVFGFLMDTVWCCQIVICCWSDSTTTDSDAPHSKNQDPLLRKEGDDPVLLPQWFWPCLKRWRNALEHGDHFDSHSRASQKQLGWEVVTIVQVWAVPGMFYSIYIFNI